jgi:hypothetical protein
MEKLVMFVMCCVALPVHAQVFKCEVNGKVQYQGLPCQDSTQERAITTPVNTKAVSQLKSSKSGQSQRQSGDMILEYGDGDSIRIGGGGGGFYCDDPRYADMKKVPTWTLQFSGGTKYLCELEDENPTKRK